MYAAIHTTIGTKIITYDIPMMALLVNPVESHTATICSDTIPAPMGEE